MSANMLSDNTDISPQSVREAGGAAEARIRDAETVLAQARVDCQSTQEQVGQMRTKLYEAECAVQNADQRRRDAERALREAKNKLDLDFPVHVWCGRRNTSFVRLAGSSKYLKYFCVDCVREFEIDGE